MAGGTNKYWISGASANFSDDTKWSLASGGGNNTTHPTGTDVANFVTGSGNGDCTVAANVSCGNIAMSGISTGPQMTVNNGVTLTAGVINISGTKGISNNGTINCTGFTVTAGTISNNSGAFNVTGNFTFNGNSLAIDLGSGPVSISGNLGIAGSTAFSFKSTSGILSLGGNLSYTGPSAGGGFLHNGGTINLTGVDQTINGAAFTYYNFEKIISGKLTLQASTSHIVQAMHTLTGMTIVSSTPGTAIPFNITGPVAWSGLTISDMQNVNANMPARAIGGSHRGNQNTTGILFNFEDQGCCMET